MPLIGAFLFNRKGDRQLKSNNLSVVDGQLEIPLARRPERSFLSVETIAKQKNLMSAITLCIAQSGLEDKEVTIPLKIDKGHWTRIKNGEAHFPVNKLNALMDLCDNEIPLIWLAHNRGYELKPLLSTLEQQLEAANAREAEKDKQIEILTNLLKR